MFKKLVLISFIACITTSLAQESDEMVQEKEKIKAAIIEETNAWRENDYKRWVDAWGHDAYIFWVNSGVDFYYEYDSWNEFVL